MAFRQLRRFNLEYIHLRRRLHRARLSLQRQWSNRRSLSIGFSLPGGLRLCRQIDHAHEAVSACGKGTLHVRSRILRITDTIDHLDKKIAAGDFPVAIFLGRRFLRDLSARCCLSGQVSGGYATADGKAHGVQRIIHVTIEAAGTIARSIQALNHLILAV